MCKVCHKHRGIKGRKCLYCIGLNPPKRTSHRRIVLLLAFVTNPMSFFIIFRIWFAEPRLSDIAPHRSLPDYNIGRYRTATRGDYSLEEAARLATLTASSLIDPFYI